MSAMNATENNISDTMEGFPKEFADDFSKKAHTPKQIFTRSAYKNFISTFTVQNDEKIKGFDGLKLLKEFKRKLKSTMREHGQIKYYAVARLLMKKKLEGKTIEKTDDFYVSAPKHELVREDQIKESIGSDIDYLKDAIPERQAKTGSNWIFMRVVSLEAHTVRHKPLAGSSYIELPEPLKLKKAIINVQNKDQEFFKWAVLSALFPADKNANRVSKYQEHEHKLDWSGLTFPVPLSNQISRKEKVSQNQIQNFENNNNISVNVYGCDIKKKLGDWKSDDEKLLSKNGTKEQKKEILERRKGEATYHCSPHVLYTSDIYNAETEVNLLYLQTDDDEETNDHYCWIKRFSAFARHSTEKGQPGQNGALPLLSYTLWQHVQGQDRTAEAGGAPGHRLPPDQ